ncbi:hypothetical protein J6590_084373 [Homalodisca vitripennis]|nr:hypothetical protein J6590_084373 [Homalodisca vitripennis]
MCTVARGKNRRMAHTHPKIHSLPDYSSRKKQSSRMAVEKAIQNNDTRHKLQFLGVEFVEKGGAGWVRGAERQVRPAATSTTADIGLMRVSRHCTPLKLYDSKILLVNKIKYYNE